MKLVVGGTERSASAIMSSWSSTPFTVASREGPVVDMGSSPVFWPHWESARREGGGNRDLTPSLEPRRSSRPMKNTSRANRARGVLGRSERGLHTDDAALGRSSEQTANKRSSLNKVPPRSGHARRRGLMPRFRRSRTRDASRLCKPCSRSVARRRHSPRDASRARDARGSSADRQAVLSVHLHTREMGVMSKPGTAAYSQALLLARAVLRGEGAPLLEDFVATVLHLADADRGFIVLLGASGEHEVRPARDRGGEPISSTGASRTLVRRAIAERDAIIIDEAALHESSSLETRQLGIRSAIAAPLIVAGTPIGALIVQKLARSEPFTPRARDAVSVVADL